MAAKKVSFSRRVDTGAARVANKLRTSRLMRETGEGKSLLERRLSGGSVKQRDVSSAVTTAGGRGSRAVQEAKEFARTLRTGKPSAATVIKDLGDRFDGANRKLLLKGALRGMLSPAGLAEGVAGATVRAMRDAGVPMDPSEAARKGMFGKKAQKAAGKRYSRGPESA